MRFDSKLFGSLTLIAFGLFLTACSRPPTPTQHVIVITVPGAQIAAATFTPVVAAGLTDQPLPDSTPRPCTSESVGPCILVTETPVPSSMPLLRQPTETITANATIAPTLTPTLTSPPSTATRSPSAPTISESTLTLKAYPWHDHLLDTQPNDPIYPYPRLDYDPFNFDPGTPTPQTFKTIILENKFVSLTFLPEFGGRLYRWLDKTTGRQLLYNNPVIKATGYGVRGWWLSLGGLEWGLPVEDHGFVEWVPWNYATVVTPDSAAVVFSIAEERTGLECAIRIELDSTHSYFALTPVLHNPTSNTLAYQFWMSAIAAPGGDNRAGPDLRFNIPTDSMQVHSTDDKTLPPIGQTISWPVYKDRDLSLYGNWREYLSLFATTGASQPYVGLYAPRTDQGLVRIFPNQTLRGLKLFGPGNLPQFIWTDDDSSYVELWGGLTSNFSENALLPPDESLSWTEYWYPFHNIGNFVWANKDVALSLNETNDSVTVGLYLTSAQSLAVTLFVNNQPVARWDAVTTAPSPWQATWPRTAAGPTGMTLADKTGTIITRYGQTP